MTQIPENLASRLADYSSRLGLPSVAVQIVELGQNTENDLGAVADAVGSDPVIAEKIMRMANSGFYAQRRQSANLRQAMIVLGLNATFMLALGFSVVSTFRAVNLKTLNFDEFWKRSLLAGVWGKLLAMEFGRRDAEELFVASLLQDIGMLVIDEMVPEVYGNFSPFAIEHSLSCDHEKTALQTDHRAIGAWLLQNWKVPETIVQAVRHSHELTAADVSPAIRGFTRTVALTSQLSDVFLSSPDAAAIRQIGRLAHKHFGILPNRLAELMDTVRQQAIVAEEIFGMQVFSHEGLQEMSDTAQDILVIPNVHTMQTGRPLSPEPSNKDNAAYDFGPDRDGATGVYNRKGLEKNLRRELTAAQKNQWPLSVIAVHLDRCDELGESHGSSTREGMLREIVEILIENVRETDYVAEFDDHEFVLVLPGRESEAAKNVAERLLAAAHGRNTVSDRGNTLNTTLSLGIATHDIDNKFNSPHDLVSAADEALYHSQRSGRDQCTSYADIKAA